MLLDKGLHDIFLIHLRLIGPDTLKGRHKNLGPRGVAIMRPIVLAGRIRCLTCVTSARGKGSLALEELLDNIPHLSHHAIHNVLIASQKSKAIPIKDPGASNTTIYEFPPHLFTLFSIQGRENRSDGVRCFGHVFIG